MKRHVILFVLIFLAACATTGQEEKITAVRDFIEVNELEKAASIRTLYDRVDQHVLNDRFVIVSVRKEQYLLEYSYPCREDPFTRRPRPDIRRDSTAIYAGSDTFRGCQIRAFYAITEDQAQELKNIGKAPGE